MKKALDRVRRTSADSRNDRKVFHLISEKIKVQVNDLAKELDPHERKEKERENLSGSRDSSIVSVEELRALDFMSSSGYSGKGENGDEFDGKKAYDDVLQFTLVTEMFYCDLEKHSISRLILNIPWTQEELFYTYRSLLNIVVALTRMKIFQRVISPENFVIVEGGFIKIKSLRQAELCTPKNNNIQTKGGQADPRYLPPELREKNKCKIDPLLCNIYSIGVTMVDLVILSLPGYPDHKAVKLSEGVALVKKMYPALAKILELALSENDPIRRKEALNLEDPYFNCIEMIPLGCKAFKRTCLRFFDGLHVVFIIIFTVGQVLTTLILFWNGKTPILSIGRSPVYFILQIGVAIFLQYYMSLIKATISDYKKEDVKYIRRLAENNFIVICILHALTWNFSALALAEIYLFFNMGFTAVISLFGNRYLVNRLNKDIVWCIQHSQREQILRGLYQYRQIYITSTC
eukprot:TRINITY_DN7047_c0_g1_i1.p1 TRINITY_DN7047_c0_g1~~TRINITY_DN7047_c0_g1_i1.p1  ORF type:complete len:462 (+),score=97.31 TRINITY_DN7047_c0_g1_i1:709-2094(+)